MEAFKASLTNELEKIAKRKKIMVAIIISLALIVLGQLAVFALRSELGLRSVSGMSFPTLVLSIFANTILPLFTALISIDIFTGEFSHNTMKIALVRPASRLKLFSVKITAIAIFTLVILFIVMLFSTITGLVFSSSTPTLQGLSRIILSYLVTFLPNMVLAMIITFMANIMKNGTSVLFMSVIFFIVFKALGYLFYQYSSLFITSMLDWYNLWIAARIPLMKVLRLFLIMAGYGIIFFMAGYYIFEKRDI